MEWPREKRRRTSGNIDALESPGFDQPLADWTVESVTAWPLTNESFTLQDIHAIIEDGPRGFIMSASKEASDCATSVFRVDHAGRAVLLAGSLGERGDVDAVGNNARFGDIEALVLSKDGTKVFISDVVDAKIKQLDLTTMEVTTLAGSIEGDLDGIGTSVQFCPTGITLSRDGKYLYLADSTNYKIKRLTLATGQVTTIAGSGQDGDRDGASAEAKFSKLNDVVMSIDDTVLYVTDMGNNKVLQISLPHGEVTTLAGKRGRPGDCDGPGVTARFNEPCGLALSVDGGTLYIADRKNHKIRGMSTDTKEVSTYCTCYSREHRRPIAKNRWTMGQLVSFTLPHTVQVTQGGHELLILFDRGPIVGQLGLGPPPLVVPPSTLAADLRSTLGDATLPQGVVTFIVGPERQRIEHVSRNLLCVRSEYFNSMFRAGMQESRAAEVEIPDACPTAFRALLEYLLCDRLNDDTSAEAAFHLAQLARKYTVPRLEMMCLQAAEGKICPSNVLQLLEAAHHAQDGRLLAHCRHFVAKNSDAFRGVGALQQLQNIHVARGLLSDAFNRIAQLEQAAKAVEPLM